MKPLLEIDNLHIEFQTEGGSVKAVRGASFSVNPGEVVAVVGESGCGKSVTAQSILGLIPSPPGKTTSGSIHYEDKDIVHLRKKELRRLRGSEISMIFQDPMTSLNPTMRVGKQIAEIILKHEKVKKAEAKTRSVELLKRVGIPAPEKRYDQYPHEFSGGMRQRVMIAIALACNPKLLIADEPTTALDVTIQAQIIDLLKDLQHDFNTSIILITHDLGIVADIAQKVVVMYAGKIVEEGSIASIYNNPSHPYTKGLLEAVPRVSTDKNHTLKAIDGVPPDLFSPPKGCPFASRCEFAMEICLSYMPEPMKLGENHKASCWLHDPRAPKAESFIAAGRDSR